MVIPQGMQYMQQYSTNRAQILGGAYQQQQQFPFPQYPTYNQLPYQLPLAQLQPLIAQRGSAGETGPAAIFVITGGAASGMAWMRRKKKK
jgi:hypothetical protein